MRNQKPTGSNAVKLTAAIRSFEGDAAEPRRRKLVEELKAGGITDPRVLECVRALPRHLFFDTALTSMAYDNNALPIGKNQTISRPYTVAFMTQVAELAGDETVLEIGTGSGYQTAVLSLMCSRVITVERINSLSNKARKVFNHLGLSNIMCLVGDGSLGAEKHGPYDAILVTAVAPSLPEPLIKQLKTGGRLVAPVGTGPEQKLVLARKRKWGVDVKELEDCRFVPLVGERGFGKNVGLVKPHSANAAPAPRTRK
ncbi:MAG: protein-L-isoaspartate(D-aspartate) O-methyltransferase [Nitrospinae bacterium]|nr:protein-L-isoaspartate(D-aspartate) O-methyltransferase [Nitrospinota bacterium]